MKILRAYKTELDLNDKQRTACLKHAGTARWAYNWGLARKIEAYRAGEKVPTAIDLHRELNELKHGAVGWMYEVSKCAPQEALRDLDRAYANFFRRAKQKKNGTLKGKTGFPKFKSRKKGAGRFRLTGRIVVLDDAIQLPRLGKLRLKERGYLPVSGVHILSATVSQRAGGWFVSLQVETEIPAPVPSLGKPAAGVDLGVKTLATVSDGTEFPNPKALKSGLERIKRFQRSVRRRKKGGKNRAKAAAKLAKAQARVANIRINTLHQVTTWLTKTKSAICIEDLNVAGMLKNHRLAAAIADVGFGEFRRQLEYKGRWYGCEIQVADRFFPSSKKHFECGFINYNLTLADREWLCPYCGQLVERDLNASKNLRSLIAPTASSAESHAWGESVSPVQQAGLVEPGTKQQLYLV